MLVEPADLSAATVLGVVQDLWDPGVVACAYVPKGAGAHHWACSGKHRPRWFVTADVVTEGGRLAELLDTYAAARELADRGHHVVVPTVPTTAGETGVVLGAYLITLSAYEEGESGPRRVGDWGHLPFAGDNQRALIAGALGALHATPAPASTPDWSPGPPRRTDLDRLLAQLDAPWEAGPFGERVRKALQDSGSELSLLFARYDELAAHAVARRDQWVPTHGEPHTANVLWLPGGPRLVDWESLRVAPRERDLRVVLRGAEGAEPLSAYVAHGGDADLDADMVELFDLEWWLWEMASYAVRFHEPHAGDADDERFFQAFADEVVPAVRGL